MLSLLQCIKTTLESVGITPASKAYYYLLVLIERRVEVIKNPTVMLNKYQLMQEYKYLAEQYDTTVPAIERIIRHAIVKASKQYPDNPIYNNVTNKTFIYIISQMVVDAMEQED